ncbi:MAG: TusE/DsrC/DsvC family sulfur relay protein [SAR324 cluster bacterium]|nr:TusE/DsrC/DsvC family sulfur relay protein [SAR324 cluster bacterium]
MTVEVMERSYEVDENGYLVNLDDWSEDVANELAQDEEIEMTDEHWDIVNFLKDYYQEFQIAPAVKVLTKEIAKKNDIKRKEASAYLYNLFPNGPALQACKIAGLPKPTGCV